MNKAAWCHPNDNQGSTFQDCKAHILTFARAQTHTYMHSGLAEEGSGTYSFIPDAGFLGTVFVNCTSNMLTSMSCPTASLSLNLPADIKITAVLGGTLHGGSHVRLPALQYGQTRDILVKLHVPSSRDGEPVVTGKLAYRTVTVGMDRAHEVEYAVRLDDVGSTIAAGQLDRLVAVQAIKSVAYTHV